MGGGEGWKNSRNWSNWGTPKSLPRRRRVSAYPSDGGRSAERAPDVEAGQESTDGGHDRAMTDAENFEEANPNAGHLRYPLTTCVIRYAKPRKIFQDCG